MGNNINGAKYRDAPLRVIKRILAAERTVTAEGCWLWCGELSRDGYGQERYRTGGKRPHVYVHRLVYMHLVGDLDDSDELDHLCHDPAACVPVDGKCIHRRCFNPDHLEPVTTAINTLRSGSISGVKSRRDRCDKGHLFNEANTRWYKGARHCRKCQREWQIENRKHRNALKRVREQAKTLAARQGRVCKICGSDISHRTRKAIYCEECAVTERQRRDRARWERKEEAA